MTESLIERMRNTSHLSSGSVAYIESMYEEYLQNANDVPEEWRNYFSTLKTGGGTGNDIVHSTIVTHFERLGRNRFKARLEKDSDAFLSDHERKQIRVLELINTYRTRGHLRAKIDPLGLQQRPEVPELKLEYHDLSLADLDTDFSTGSSQFFAGDSAPLSDIVNALEETYCGSIGAEYTYVQDEQEELWIRHGLESVHSNPSFGRDHKRSIFEHLTAAEGLERYLQNRYPGTKRFGLEGGESLIPMIHEILQRMGTWEIIEVVIGMAHRGRLNVLVNILGKETSDLFDEFEGNVILAEDANSGDVKYHQGFSSNVLTNKGEMHVALTFNPSHLEIVNPVVAGSVRARQDRRRDSHRVLVAPIMVHGDAAFAGQGVVMETFQMSQTRGYGVGGTVHVILNNQIGFTTSNPNDARSTEYCSAIAKMVNAPVLHVNADDPEAVVFAAQLAVDYRMVFAKDIVIDLVCYRRRGHNEAEEPMKTQPMMYQEIHQHPTTRAIYATQLEREGILEPGGADRIAEEFRDRLDQGESVAVSITHDPDTSLFVDWTPYLGKELSESVDTHCEAARIQDLNKKLGEVPQGFVVHRQVTKILEDRSRMAAGAAAVNWGFAETMAYATLLDEGYKIRLTGQDVGVGTFSHRHAVMHCQKTGDEYVPLQSITDREAFAIYDSLLSEEAVLAFEYGYATTTPDALVIWEAQFGDFANGAQVVIDQFLSSGGSKWSRLCGLVMFLPHGYEGQGPEHSSARLERYLQLCAEQNMQVCVPTTPSQIFHLLRRQAIRPVRIPLVVLTPKSLLRHKLASSTIDEFTSGGFEHVLPDIDPLDTEKVTRVVLCSGKVFYDLLETRRKREVDDVALVRIEQLYPFPDVELGEMFSRFPNLSKIVWCQEEPKNQGAWYIIKHRIEEVIEETRPELELTYAGRRRFAAPAGGDLARHKVRQAQLAHDALYG